MVEVCVLKIRKNAGIPPVAFTAGRFRLKWYSARRLQFYMQQKKLGNPPLLEKYKTYANLEKKAGQRANKNRLLEESALSIHSGYL